MIVDVVRVGAPAPCASAAESIARAARVLVRERRQTAAARKSGRMPQPASSIPEAAN
jgi:hypothetical protein